MSIIILRNGVVEKVDSNTKDHSVTEVISYYGYNFIESGDDLILYGPDGIQIMRSKKSLSVKMEMMRIVDSVIEADQARRI